MTFKIFEDVEFWVVRYYRSSLSSRYKEVIILGFLGVEVDKWGEPATS